jgi:hypothetical protein
MSIKKLGPAQTKADDGLEYVIVRVEYAAGTVEDVEYCASCPEADARCQVLNERGGCGPGYCHGFMTTEAFEALTDADDDDDEDEDDDELCGCGDPDCTPF